MRIWLTCLYWLSGIVWEPTPTAYPLTPDGASNSTHHQSYFAEVDHEALTISFEANFYPGHGLPDEQKQIEEAVRFWNSQSHRFVYRLLDGRESLEYLIVFRLREIEGAFDENGFFRPAEAHDARHLIPLSLVAQADLDRLQSHQTAHQIVGYAPPHHIYISHAYKHETLIGMHEVGHQLGAGHTYWDIMNHSLEGAVPKVSKTTIYDLLASIGIGRQRSAHKARSHAAPIEHVMMEKGLAPDGFYTMGKVKRLR